MKINTIYQQGKFELLQNYAIKTEEQTISPGLIAYDNSVFFSTQTVLVRSVTSLFYMVLS